MNESSHESEDVARLRRWTDSGAHWQVLTRTERTVEIAMLTCSGGEEADRMLSDDPALLAYVGDRWSSGD